MLGSGSPGAPMSSWPRGRRLLAEPGFSIPGLLSRGKLLSARAAWGTQGGALSGWRPSSIVRAFMDGTLIYLANPAPPNTLQPEVLIPPPASLENCSGLGSPTPPPPLGTEDPSLMG